jgi:predicted nucleotidyltransferase
MVRAEIRSGKIGADTLSEVVARLAAALQPVRIYLFGSQAYGEPHDDSDVDLMVVLPGPVPRVSECYGTAHASLRGLRVPVELHFVSAAGFERRRKTPGSLDHEVAERGRLDYECR